MTRSSTAVIRQVLLGVIAAVATHLAVADAQGVAEVLAGRSVPDTAADFCFDANRRWRATNPIPGSYPWNSEYVEQADDVSDKLGDLIWSGEAPTNVRHFVSSFMDLQARDARGLRPLAQILSRIDSLETGADTAVLIAILNKSHRDLVPGVRFPTPTPFYFYVWASPMDSRRQVARFAASGLALPDRSYYLDSALSELRTAYGAHIERVLSLAGFSNPHEMAAEALMVETAIAEAQGSLAAQQNGGISARALMQTGLAELAPEFDWATFFDEAALRAADEIVVEQPQYLRDVVRLFAELPLGAVKAYFRWQLLHRYSDFLSSAYSEERFDFFGRTLQGASRPPEPRQQAQTYTEAFLAWDLSEDYVRRYVPESDKAAADLVAENVRTAFIDRIQTASWLSESARDEATRKLKNLVIGMLYPDERDDIPLTELSSADLVGNLITLSEHNYSSELQRLREPTKRDRWWNSPVTVNGSYSVTTNSLIITAARASKGLLGATAADPEIYGGLGTLVAHEMGHALDDQGSLYDADGNLGNWWSDDDRREFERRGASLADQYSLLEPLPGMHIDGRAVLSESIADLAGLGVGYDAFEIALSRRGEEITETARRRFFEAWARRWRVQYTEPLLVRILRADTHPPLQYRCSVPLSNFGPFYAVVGVDPASPLFIASDDRVTIW